MNDEKKDNVRIEYDKERIFLNSKVYPDATKLFTPHRTLDEIKNDAIIILDTNVLLLPYTARSESFKAIKKVYRKLKKEKRLLIPAQVAREFVNNRPQKLADIYDTLVKMENISTPPAIHTFPLLEDIEIVKELPTLKEKIQEAVKEYKNKIAELKSMIKDWRWDDPISKSYSELFGTNIIVEIDGIQEKQEDLVECLKLCHNHGLPPGYKDKQKDDCGIGDLLIWKVILQIGEKQSKDIIFVSNDSKADWWHQGGGQALYPRYELIEEFRNYTKGKNFQIVDLAKLLEIYNVNDEGVLEDLREQQRVNNEIFCEDVEILKHSFFEDDKILKHRLFESRLKNKNHFDLISNDFSFDISEISEIVDFLKDMENDIGIEIMKKNRKIIEKLLGNRFSLDAKKIKFLVREYLFNKDDVLKWGGFRVL